MPVCPCDREARSPEQRANEEQNIRRRPTVCASSSVVQDHDESGLHRSGSEALGCRIRFHHLIVLRLGELRMRDQLTPAIAGRHRAKVTFWNESVLYLSAYDFGAYSLSAQRYEEYLSCEILTRPQPSTWPRVWLSRSGSSGHKRYTLRAFLCRPPTFCVNAILCARPIWVLSRRRTASRVMPHIPSSGLEHRWLTKTSGTSATVWRTAHGTGRLHWRPQWSRAPLPARTRSSGRPRTRQRRRAPGRRGDGHVKAADPTAGPAPRSKGNWHHAVPPVVKEVGGVGRDEVALEEQREVSRRRIAHPGAPARASPRGRNPATG